MKETVNAGLTQAFIAIAVEFGIPRADALAYCRVTEAQIADPDGRIPLVDHMRVWDVLFTLKHPWLGLEMGKAFNLGFLGVLGYLMGQAETLDSAGRIMERYAKLVSELFMPSIGREDGRAVWEQILSPGHVKLRHPAENCMAATMVMVRQLTGKNWPVRFIGFQHPAPPDVSELTRFFGIEVQFGQPTSRLEFDVAVLDAPILRADERLYGYLQLRADTLLAQHSGGSLVERLRRHLMKTLRNGEPRQEDAARSFGLSERTLQRRLKDEGLTFAGVLEEVRAEAARSYLQERSLAVYEVALLLGYSEPSAFHRAFKRWTKVTPQEFREQLGTT